MAESSPDPAPTGKLRTLAASGKLDTFGVAARGLVADMIPGGRQLLELEAEVERTRLYAETIGLPATRADEVLHDVMGGAARWPRVEPIATLGREARRRLTLEAVDA